MALLWPANALILASALLGKPRQIPGRVVAGSIGTFFANAVTGAALLTSLGYAVANGIEVVVALAAIRAAGLHNRAFGRLDTIAGFCVIAGGIAPAVGALFGAGFATLFAGQSFIDVFSIWYRSCALGALLVTPMAIILWRSRDQLVLPDWGQAAGMLASLCAVGTVTVAAFSLPLPLLFLPLAAIVIATVRVGWLGAMRSTLVVALIGSVFTLKGYGPIAQLVSKNTQATFLQFYIAACFLTALAVAALLEDRRRLTRALVAAEARYRLLSEHSADALLHVDTDGTCLYASPASADLIGLTPVQLEGTNLARFVHPEDRAVVQQTHLDVIAMPDTSRVCRYRVRHREAGERWLETRTRGIHDADGVVSGAVSVIRDITADVVREANLSVAAETDPLTGLANRRCFLAALERQQQVSGETGFAVAMLDLDHFKLVNDTYGHAAGDEVLKQVARASGEAVRSNDVVGRLGGEEFALLLPGADERTAIEIGERVRAAIEALSVMLDVGARIRVTVSVGVALGQPGFDAAGLLAIADMQLYAAKIDGRNRLRVAA